jgi:hypothetical protein
MQRAALIMCLSVVTTSAAAQARPDSVPPAPRAEAIVLRSFVGLGGAAGLAIVGGKIGYHYERSHYFCNCDDPGLEGMLVGGSLGYLVGSIVVPAIPAFGRGCSFPARLGRSAMGAVSTFAGGVVAAALTGGFGIVVVLAAPVGAAAAQGRC